MKEELTFDREKVKMVGESIIIMIEQMCKANATECELTLENCHQILGANITLKIEFSKAKLKYAQEFLDIKEG